MFRFLSFPADNKEISNAIDSMMEAGNGWKKVGAQIGKISSQDSDNYTGSFNVLQNSNLLPYSLLHFSLYTPPVRPALPISGSLYEIIILNADTNFADTNIVINYENIFQWKQMSVAIDKIEQSGSNAIIKLQDKIPTGLIPSSWKNIQIISDKYNLDNMSELSNISGISYSRKSLFGANWEKDSIDPNSVNITVDWGQIGLSGSLIAVGICDSINSGNLIYYNILSPQKNIDNTDLISIIMNGLFFKFKN